jgi:hypothetical protein
MHFSSRGFNSVNEILVHIMSRQRFGILVVSLLLTMALLAVPVMAAGIGAPTQIAAQAGLGQSATVGNPVAVPPSVIVRDAANSPVPGVSVTFAVGSGGGSVTLPDATTDSSGVATVGSWTLGTTAGVNTLTATSAGLAGSPVTFSASGTAGAATQLAKNAGDTQSATVGTAVSTPPSVIVKDTNGNPVANIAVVFEVASGSGSVSGGTTTTGTNGIASAGGWTLGPTAGANTLTATVTGLSAVTFTATGLSATSMPTITSIEPATGINNGLVRGIVITGTGYTSTTTARLVKSGQSNISMVNPSFTATTITCDFPLNNALPGTWDVVVVNADGGTATRSNAFTVVNATTVSTVTVISPTSGTANTTVTATITGTGFATNARMRLARSGYNDILGSVTSAGTTSIVGTFDLTNQVPGTWLVCVLYDGSNRVCGPPFTINSATAPVANGSIYFTSSPSGATVWLGTNKSGITPLTLQNIKPGTYTVKYQKSNYLDWSSSITVTSGAQTDVYGKLNYYDSTTTAPTATPILVTTATLPPTTVKSTKTVPTPWSSTTTATQSPVELVVLIGAVGLGIVLLRRP